MQQVTPAPQFIATGLAAPGAALSNPVLTVNLRLISPVSSAVGSPTLQFNQVVAAAQVPAAGFLVIVLMFIVQLVAWICGEDRVRLPDPNAFPAPDGAVTMSLSELAAFMERLKNGSLELPTAPVSGPDSGMTRPGVQVRGPANLTLYLVLGATVSGREGAVIVGPFVPLVEFVGITGGLPIIIIGLIATILTRAVVPPTASGIHPQADPQPEPVFQLKWQELIQLLKGYGKHFK